MRRPARDGVATTRATSRHFGPYATIRIVARLARSLPTKVDRHRELAGLRVRLDRGQLISTSTTAAWVMAALLLLLASITFNADPAEAAKCSGIRDSAQCAAQPGCHFDVNKRRCSQGPRPTEDACIVHVDKVVCTTDTTLGCGWSAEKKKCITKPH